jgi:SNF2 family DNA or RNA helicase
LNWIDRLQWLTENGHFSRRKFLRITGAENEKKREDAKSKFQEMEEYDLIFINNAAIEAINLQQAAHMVCLDMPWSWGDTTQLVGRMLRLASPHSACTLHVMYAAGTVDEYTIEVLKSKKGLFEKIFGESFSAGVLDDGEAQDEIDLSSGIDTVRDHSEFRDLLKAHVKPVKLTDFVSGDALHRQKHGKRETLLERGKKPKVSIEEMAAKWR